MKNQYFQLLFNEIGDTIMQNYPTTPHPPTNPFFWAEKILYLNLKRKNIDFCICNSLTAPIESQKWSQIEPKMRHVDAETQKAYFKFWSFSGDINSEKFSFYRKRPFGPISRLCFFFISLNAYICTNNPMTRTHPYSMKINLSSIFYCESFINLFAEYFKQKPWNLLVVDYNPVARWGCYFDTLVPSIIKIGECIGDLLVLLFKLHPKITIDRFHFVGFSMGSQICAQVSNTLKSSQIIIPRITGTKY